MARLLRRILLFCCLFGVSGAFTLDLGRHGHVYPVSERSMLELVRSRVGALDDLASLQESLHERFVHRLRHPSPVADIGKAETYQSREYDPTITLEADIVNHKGEVLFAKGTKCNPLDTVSLPSPLLFLDGADEEQIIWAKKQGVETRWILVRGCPLDLEEAENRPVYFDQHGLLTGKLGIRSVPARVSQSGTRLKIEEVPVGGGPCAG